MNTGKTHTKTPVWMSTSLCSLFFAPYTMLHNVHQLAQLQVLLHWPGRDALVASYALVSASVQCETNHQHGAGPRPSLA
ncbi:unnamed protein product [Ixodes pacificus]